MPPPRQILLMACLAGLLATSAPVRGQDAPPGPQAFYAGVDYLLWSYKRGRVNEPLATTTNSNVLAGDPFVPVVLFGNQDLGSSSMRSGIRFVAGVALGDTGLWFEGSGFLLERDQSVTRFDPASTLSPGVLARPVIDAATGLTSQNVLNLGNVTAGSLAIRSTTQLYGVEANAALPLCGLVKSVFAGYRYLALREELNIDDRNLVQTAGLGFFNGRPVIEGDVRTKSDNFETTNDFHGAQLGARLEARYYVFDVSARPSVALGVTQQILGVNGTTTRTPPPNSGPATTLPGGLLALPSNMRREVRTNFAVAPELELALGVRVLPNVRLSAGYNFLYLSSAVRPGDQIDRRVSASQLPISSAYNPSAPAFFPQPLFKTSDFWAHGLSLGMQITY